jgi:hypothetical protein
VAFVFFVGLVAFMRSVPTAKDRPIWQRVWQIRTPGRRCAVDSAAGQHLEAIRMIGLAEALTETTGASAPQMPMIVAQVEEAARQAIGDEIVTKAIADSRNLSVAQVVDYASTFAGIVASTG